MSKVSTSETTDRDALLRYFTVEKLTDERNYYGANKRRLEALKSKQANRRRKLGEVEGWRDGLGAA
jgi:hypothetical protein